jgi:acyl-CoA synthetase (AMP-forming)/AMP-acid ligase II
MTESEPWAYHPDGSPVYSLADIIRKRAAATPAAVALAEAHRLTSFADLDRRSSQVARALQARGVRPGDRVAFIGANGPEFVEVLYGAAKGRAIFTAVNNRLSRGRSWPSWPTPSRAWWWSTRPSRPRPGGEI